MNIQLKKMKTGRRRFLKTALPDSLDWLSVAGRLKKIMADETQLGPVGEKSILAVTPTGFELMIEVVGIPAIPERKGLALVDLESMDVLLFEPKDANLFTINLMELVGLAEKIKLAMGKGDARLHDVYHIVLDGEKIGLHFFGQKDYSQNLL